MTIPLRSRTGQAGRRTAISPEAIPEELRKLPLWVTWRWKKRKDGSTKPPYNPLTDKIAKPNDVSTCGTFQQALTAYKQNSRVAGIGFLFTEGDPFVGVDLDDCRDPETGEVDDWASKIVDSLNSYTEVSPSGTGVKIFARGGVPRGRKKKPYKSGAVEIYDRGRYFTVTGWHLEGTPTRLEQRQAEIDALYEKVFGNSDKKTCHRTQTGRTEKADTYPYPEGDRASAGLLGALNRKIESLRERKPRFDRTWRHDRPDLDDQSDSGYDLSLASIACADGWSDGEIGALLRAHRRTY